MDIHTCSNKLTLRLKQNNLSTLKITSSSTFLKIFCDFKTINNFGFHHKYQVRIITNISIEGIFNTGQHFEFHCHNQSFERIRQFNASGIVNPLYLFNCLGTTLEELHLLGNVIGKQINLPNSSQLNLDLSAIRRFENLKVLAIRNYAPIIVNNIPVLASF